ncbi:MAG: biopolymer transporter ExbD [Kiritimatiellales bacterium]|nr:biopolymer transporter ExbD [Kiritimatiellales bacterium]
MSLSSGYETKKARVEMLPLIDVVFLLLVFFIYAFLSMVLHRGLKVDLPAAGSAVVDKLDYIDITIDQSNNLFLNKQPIPLERLADQVLKLRAASDSTQSVFISGDREADLGLAIQILDMLRKAGIEEVSFSCSKETIPTPQP